MKVRRLALNSILVVLVVIVRPPTPAQQPAAFSATPVATSAAEATPNPSLDRLLAKLTPAQRNEYFRSVWAARLRRYAEAFAGFEKLLSQVPGDPLLSKAASEAALNTGDPAFVFASLEPIAESDPDDWEAAALLVRACAESGNVSCRDSGMAHMLDLHKRGVIPSDVRDYLAERAKAGPNTVEIRVSFEPWGRRHTYDEGEVRDAGDTPVLRIALESDDASQHAFAKKRPDLAARGVRRFSMDGYIDRFTDKGVHTQKQALHRFFEGQPAYDTVREQFIQIAAQQKEAAPDRRNYVIMG